MYVSSFKNIVCTSLHECATTKVKYKISTRFTWVQSLTKNRAFVQNSWFRRTVQLALYVTEEHKLNCGLSECYPLIYLLHFLSSGMVTERKSFFCTQSSWWFSAAPWPVNNVWVTRVLLTPSFSIFHKLTNSIILYLEQRIECNSVGKNKRPYLQNVVITATRAGKWALNALQLAFLGGLLKGNLFQVNWHSGNPLKFSRPTNLS